MMHARRRRRRKIALVLMLLYYSYYYCEETPIFRAPNLHRHRINALNKIRAKDDLFFKDSYRMSRENFYSLLELISPHLVAENTQKAINSSGSPVDPEILLAATLRFLAGASYRDLIDLYELPKKCAHLYFWRTLNAIDQALNNINLPTTEQEWRNLSADWSNKMIVDLHEDLLPGTVLAIDGIVIKTVSPRSNEVEGNVRAQYNRKGFYAMVALCAVDVNYRFQYANLGWSGSTNDSVAFADSQLYYLREVNHLPNNLFLVGDEAYGASAEYVITPYSRSMLRNDYSQNYQSYVIKSTFNYLLSYQRSTIERAFGILLRKFSLLQQRLAFSREHIRLIFQTCCKLHNYCISSSLDFDLYASIYDYNNADDILMTRHNNDLDDENSPQQPDTLGQVRKRNELTERIQRSNFRLQGL